MARPTQQLRDFIRRYVPNWLQDVLNQNNGFKILYVLAQQLDTILDVCTQGTIAQFPGIGTVTALPTIGQQRGIVQGIGESNAAYEQRLIAWLDTWYQAGSSAIMVTEIQAYIGGSPIVRVVDRSGNWCSIDGSGNVTFVTGVPLNWDTISNPERQPPNPYWSDLWIIVNPVPWPATGLSLASLVPIWGQYGGMTVGTGHAVPRSANDTIRSIVSTWKGAHTWVEAIIWSYNATLFNPGNIGAAGNPDGTWGYWGKPSGGTFVPARTGAADDSVVYWIPPNG